MTAETLAKVQADPEALKELSAKLEEERAKHIETLKLVGQHEQTIKEKDALRLKPTSSPRTITTSSPSSPPMSSMHWMRRPRQ